MRRIKKLSLACLLAVMPLGMAAAQEASSEGMIHVQSEHNFARTRTLLQNALDEKGMRTMVRVWHSQSASMLGLELRSTEVFVFGNPKVGAPMMMCEQKIAIDLPQKALVWEDEQEVVWVSYNDPNYLKQRHKVEGCDPYFEKVSGALKAITSAATQ